MGENKHPMERWTQWGVVLDRGRGTFPWASRAERKRVKGSKTQQFGPCHEREEGGFLEGGGGKEFWGKWRRAQCSAGFEVLG